MTDGIASPARAIQRRITLLPKPTSELLHRLNRAISSARVKYAAILLADVLRLRHLIVRLDPVNACNLRCAMCFFSDPQWRKENMKGQFSKADIERLAGMFFAEALQVHIGCGMEPTIFPDYPWLVDVAKRYRVPFVGFTTNGQLLTEEAVSRMVAAGLDEVTLSAHGTTAETFETLMPGASFERFLTVLGDIDRVRAALAGKTALRINYTVCSENLTELESFFDVFGKFNIATLQLRPMADFGDTAYKNKDLTPHLPRYHAILDRMVQECRTRGVMLLANRVDPAHTKPNSAAEVYTTAILRHLNPNRVWRKDFDWRTNDYRAHKHTIGWRRELLSRALARHAAAPLSHQAIFDVY